jgi:hypothetical protein
VGRGGSNRPRESTEVGLSFLLQGKGLAGTLLPPVFTDLSRRARREPVTSRARAPTAEETCHVVRARASTVEALDPVATRARTPS